VENGFIDQEHKEVQLKVSSLLTLQANILFF